MVTFAFIAKQHPKVRLVCRTTKTPSFLTNSQFPTRDANNTSAVEVKHTQTAVQWVSTTQIWLKQMRFRMHRPKELPALDLALSSSTNLHQPPYPLQDFKALYKCCIILLTHCRGKRCLSVYIGSAMPVAHCDRIHSNAMQLHNVCTLTNVTMNANINIIIMGNGEST